MVAFAPRDDLELHAFDIDLEQTQPRKSETVDGHDVHFLALRTAERNAAEIVGPAVVEGRNPDHARLRFRPRAGTP